jgi:molecular chaperone GrpE (heat shock protein)
MSDEMKAQEFSELEALEQQIKSGEYEKMRKQASYQNYRKRRSRSE